MIKWGFFQGYKTGSLFKKSIHVIQYTNRLKKKNHVIVSIDGEKAFLKIQYPFMIKNKTKKNLSQK